MNAKNAVAATLALMAMGGFLAFMAFLTVGNIPAGNKDFINQGLIALIGFVGTAFGFYLGSSYGSAQKNELLAEAEPYPFIGVDHAAGLDKTATAIIPGKLGEAGSARVGLIITISPWIVLALIVAVLFMNGCATMQQESPQITAGKSLLAVKGTIVTAATTTDRLCKLQQIPVDDCNKAKAAYELARPAYDSAVDAYLLMSTGGDPAAFGAAITRVQSIAASMLKLAGGAQ